MTKLTVARLAVAAASLITLCAAAVGGATAASASTLPSLALSTYTPPGFSYPTWAVKGSGYPAGLSGVDLYIIDWTTVGIVDSTTIQTSSANLSCVSTPGRGCLITVGGTFSAQGGTRWIAPGNWVISSGWYENAPLRCANIYEAYTYDPSDGYVWSNTLIDPPNCLNSNSN